MGLKPGPRLSLHLPHLHFGRHSRGPHSLKAWKHIFTPFIDEEIIRSRNQIQTSVLLFMTGKGVVWSPGVQEAGDGVGKVAGRASPFPIAFLRLVFSWSNEGGKGIDSIGMSGHCLAALLEPRSSGDHEAFQPDSTGART